MIPPLLVLYLSSSENSQLSRWVRALSANELGHLDCRQCPDIFVIDGMKQLVPMWLVAAAGKPVEEIRIGGVFFEDLHRGGWDPSARRAERAY